MRLVASALLALGLTACASPTPPSPAEVRGVWLTNIDSDLLFSREGIAAGMERLADAGFNVVFPVVWNDGYTLYPSDVMARTFGEAYRIDTVFARQGRDPLAEVVAEAHARGLEVIPWFEFGFSSSYRQDGGHILAAKPDWAGRDREGNLLVKNGFDWMNALHPEVQAFVRDLVVEVATRYDVDGIQGDDRLPAMPSEGGYDAWTVAQYAAGHDGATPPDDPRDPAWLAWRADRLTAFLGSLHDAVKAVDSTLIVSMSPSVWPWSLEQYLQDWPAWIARGYVDAVHPQAYRYDIEAYRRTVDAVVRFGRVDSLGAVETPYPVPEPVAGDVVLAPGILIKSGPRYNGPDYVREALEYNRDLGLDGEVFFFYEGLWDENQFVGDSLAAWGWGAPAPLPWR